MSLPSFNQSCCQPCANLIRGVQGQFSFPGYDGGEMTSMNDWVNSYDMSTLEWGTGIVGYFSAVGQTTPDSTGFLNCELGDCYAANTTYACNFGSDGEPPCGDPVPSGGSTVTRTQYLLPLGQSYFVAAVAVNISNPLVPCDGAEFLSIGCYYPATGQPTIVELPIPTQFQTLDPSGLWTFYQLGVIDPGAPTSPFPDVLAAVEAIIPGLSSLNTTNQGFVAFGPAWADSITTECAPTPTDPFLGSDPP